MAAGREEEDGDGARRGGSPATRSVEEEGGEAAFRPTESGGDGVGPLPDPDGTERRGGKWRKARRPAMERRGGVEAAPGGGEGEMEATGSERRGEVRPPDPDLDRGREEGRGVMGRGREEWGEWE